MSSLLCCWWDSVWRHWDFCSCSGTCFRRTAAFTRSIGSPGVESINKRTEVKDATPQSQMIKIEHKVKAA